MTEKITNPQEKISQETFDRHNNNLVNEENRVISLVDPDYEGKIFAEALIRGAILDTPINYRALKPNSVSWFDEKRKEAKENGLNERVYLHVEAEKEWLNDPATSKEEKDRFKKIKVYQKTINRGEWIYD